MFLFFYGKRGSVLLMLFLEFLAKIALFKRKECFCSYFFKLRLKPFLILGNLRLSVLTELFLLEKLKRCCWKPWFICMHQAMINSFFYSKTTAHEQSRCFYFLLVFACEEKICWGAIALVKVQDSKTYCCCHLRALTQNQLIF